MLKSMVQPMVSVVIPCHNTVTFIDSCLQSVFKQSFTDLEIICVDNNSVDGTYERLLALARRDLRVRVLQEKKQGAPAARNCGLWQSRGKWIQFLDSDDLLFPDKIQHQLDLVDATNPKPDIVVGVVCKELDGKRIMWKQRPFSSDLEALVKASFGNTTANLWRRSAVFNIGGWREDLASSQDRDLFFRMIKSGASVIRDTQTLSVCRIREGSISNTNLSDNLERLIESLLETREYVSGNGDKELTRLVNDEIFGKLRELANFKLLYATRLNTKILGTSYSPEGSDVTTSKYVYIYRYLGFYHTHYLHKLFQIIKRIRRSCISD